ncbi:membrane protein insertase YidC [Consotaella salsifontis]|uniref:Membrane protein insertase YidC n=1 Tax=Consotaella salsifontis TaxID=1365950 RepID=A0A1T4Q3H8_9HYPH|nr:membrane protein insertase YidC [Consotaella salsifontis]SJZ98289.1 protein translocase subunit yidC [Consotaella salsifontis]
MQNNRNFLIAMVLSIAVLVGWQFLVVAPRMEAQRQAEQAQKGGELQTPTTPAGTDQKEVVAPAGRESVVPAETPTPAQSATREDALNSDPRVAIDTPSLSGSINLKGARLDDLRLKNYHVTVDDASPTIVLLSPEQDKDGYFAELGYSGKEAGALPGPTTLWQAQSGAVLSPDSPVTLTYTNDKGLTFTRVISVDDKFMFTIEDSVANGGSTPVSLSPWGRVVRFSKPEVASSYVLFEGLLGVFGENGLNEVTYKSIEKDGTVKPEKAANGWLGTTDKYWATAIVPVDQGAFQPTFRYSTAGRTFYQSDYLADPMEIAPGASKTFSSHTFAGAKVVDLIDHYEEALNIPHFGQLIDWGWFYFITRPMFHAIDWLYRFLGNFGLAIIAVTIVLKAIFFPLANKSYQSMARMKNLQPKIAEMRERFADDKVKQQQEMMRLYKEEKVNPAAGCWPMLIQIPIFFSLYKVLYVTIEMRHAPFYGWIHDLAAPDPTSLFNLFGLLPYDVPQMLMIGAWPLVMGVTMFVQMRLNPTPADPSQQMIFTWMPVVFTFMLAHFPAGLVIYWTCNNTLSIIQQSIIMKRNGTKIELWDNLKGMFRRKPKTAKG